VRRCAIDQKGGVAAPPSSQQETQGLSWTSLRKQVHRFEGAAALGGHVSCVRALRYKPKADAWNYVECNPEGSAESHKSRCDRDGVEKYAPHNERAILSTHTRCFEGDEEASTVPTAELRGISARLCAS